MEKAFFFGRFVSHLTFVWGILLRDESVSVSVAADGCRLAARGLCVNVQEGK